MSHTVFIANCTMQNGTFNYRLPENPRFMTENIRPLGQVQLPRKLSVKDVDHLVKKSAKYGVVRVEDVRSRTVQGAVHYIVSLDTPVSAEDMANVNGNNATILKERGREMRELAAAAAARTMAQTTPQAADTLQVEIEQQGAGAEGDKPLSEGIALTNAPLKDGGKVRGKGPGRGKSRRNNDDDE